MPIEEYRLLSPLCICLMWTLCLCYDGAIGADSGPVLTSARESASQHVGKADLQPKQRFVGVHALLSTERQLKPRLDAGTAVCIILAPADSARDRGIHAVVPGCHGERMRGAGILDIDCG